MRTTRSANKNEALLQDGGFPRSRFLEKATGETKGNGRLNFFDGNGAGFTDFNAAFTPEAFFRIDRNGFSILDFKNFHRAHINAFFTAFTFIGINNRIKSHLHNLLS
jgi:hypothetical protein